MKFFELSIAHWNLPNLIKIQIIANQIFSHSNFSFAQTQKLSAQKSTTYIGAQDKYDAGQTNIIKIRYKLASTLAKKKKKKKQAGYATILKSKASFMHFKHLPTHRNPSLALCNIWLQSGGSTIQRFKIYLSEKVENSTQLTEKLWAKNKFNKFTI